MNNIKEKVKTNYKKNKILILAFLVIWLVVCFISIYSHKDTLGKSSSGNAVYDEVAYFNGNKIIQKVDTVDGSKTISLFLSITKKDNSNIFVRVIGENSGIIYGESRIKDRNIQNDSYNAVVLDTKLDAIKDKKVNIVITSENEKENNLGIWYSKKELFGKDQLTINGEAIEGSITCKFVTDDAKFFSFYKAIIIPTIVIGVIIILFLLLLEPKKELLYAIISLYLGLIFMIIITPISGPDEDYHYKQTLILSNEIMDKENSNIIEDLYLDYEGLITQTNNSSAYKRIIDTIDEPLENLSRRPMASLEKGKVYSYVLCYVPQAIGITIGRLTRMNFLNTYYMGRLFGLLFYVLCVYIAVKKTPVMKDAFGIVATLPMFVQQSITYTQDAWICALSMVVFAFFLKWKLCKERIQIIDYFIVLVSILLLAPSKIIYSLISVLFFLVPKERFGGLRNKILLVTLFFLPTVYQLGGNIISRIKPIFDPNAFVHQTTGEKFSQEEMIEINPNFSIRYALSHPYETVHIVVNTIKVRMKTWVCTAVGRALSGGTLLIPLEIVYGFMALFIAAVLQKEDRILPISSKIVVVIVCICVAGLVLASMLVGWTKYNDPIIQGVQGRYFSPLIIYLLSILSNKKIYLPTKIDKYLVFVHLLLSFETIICILSFTFVN